MNGWIGVDLDGTLAEYSIGDGVESVGAPIPRMVERVKGWLAEGREVKIFTARVAACGMTNPDGAVDSVNFAHAQREMIEAWCKDHLGEALEVTATKNFGMTQLWDDRCVQVVPNTGMTKEEAQCAAKVP